MINLAQKSFDFHAWVKKCHFGKFSEFSKIAKMALFYRCMKIKNFLDQKHSFDVVNNSLLQFFSKSASGSVHALIYVDKSG